LGIDEPQQPLDPPLGMDEPQQPPEPPPLGIIEQFG
jgi:hypothetical protein